MAKARNVIANAKLGLADICAAVLKLRLDKSDPARLGSDWNSATLSPGQIQYAARDVYASLQIYLRLSQMSAPEAIPIDAPPGAPVGLYHNDGKLIATGTLGPSSSEPVRGISVTPTRARITVEDVVVPGALISTYKAPLQSFGSTPFEIIVKRNKLKTRSTTDSPVLTIQPIQRTSTQPPVPDDEFQAWISEESPGDNQWADDVDDDPDILDGEDGIVAEAEVDEESRQTGISTFAAVASSLVTWSRITCSLVLMDIWHAMARVKVSRTHGFRRPFAHALRDAMLIPDEDDRCQITAYLVLIGSTWEEMLLINAKWLWKRCKRVVPPPDILYPAVKEVFETYGPLLDAATGVPLFNRQAWKDAKNIMKAIQLGLLSDPVDVVLYFRMGVDKHHGNLPIYRCARGTNATEGGVHHSGRRRLPISGGSPRHANARVRDFVLMHNLNVSAKKPIFGAYSLPPRLEP